MMATALVLRRVAGLVLRRVPLLCGDKRSVGRLVPLLCGDERRAGAIKKRDQSL